MILLGQQLLAQQPGPPPQAPPVDVLTGALGIAAILLVVGWTLTRWQRDRQRFALMQTALEKGVTRFPGTPPYWLISLRQGITLSAVGIGLAGAGGGAWWLAHSVPMAAADAANAQSVVVAPQKEDAPEHLPPPQGRPPFDRDDAPESHGGRSPWNAGPPESHGPNHPPREDRQGPDSMRPQQFNPQHLLHDQQHENWRRAQAQQTMGLVSVATGFILLLVGIVRIGFAKVEQRYASESDEAAY